jgi:hypothetical protein
MRIVNGALTIANMMFIDSPETVFITAGLHATLGRINVNGCLFQHNNPSYGFTKCIDITNGAEMGLIYGNDFKNYTSPVSNLAPGTAFHVGGAVGIGQPTPASGLHIGADAGGSHKGYITLEDVTNQPGAPGTGKAVIYFRSGALRAKIGTSPTEKTFTLT